MVWCLGKSCIEVDTSSLCFFFIIKYSFQALKSDHSDVSLFSLLNLMTVGHVLSRPTLAKVRLMVRNRLGIVDLEKVPEIIADLYKEVMGDLDELVFLMINESN